MKNIIVTLSMILLASCTKYDQKYIVHNTSKPQTIILKNREGINVTSISIKGYGHIDGNAQIILMLNGKPYKSENISGNIKFKWSSDWYSNDATIIYTPQNVTTGNLIIEYNFNLL